MTKTFLCLSICFCFIITQAQQLLRGPYMQQKTSSSIFIKWRTDTTTNSKVYYGTDLNNLVDNVFIPAAVTDHEVQLTGLQPNTQYFYKIESSGITLSGPDNQHHFKTAPIPGTVQPIRVWAIGDFGKGNQGQKDTRDSYVAFSQNTAPDVWLWLGDNAYQDGRDNEYQEHVFDSTFAFGEIFKYMDFYPCPGNHDYNSICAAPTCNQHPDDHRGAYYDIITVPTQAEAGGTPSTREHYYSYDYGNAHFISLNSELGTLANAAFDWTGVLNGDFNNLPMMQWLKADLQANDKPWIIAYWHQPPFSKGSHDSDSPIELFMKAMRENFLPTLEEYGVDLVINGHSHVFERSHLINGFYGNSGSFDPNVHLVSSSSGNETLGEPYRKFFDGPEPNKGTVYVVAGNGGSSTSNPPLMNNPHPVMYFSDGGNDVFGSFIIDINDNKLKGRYLSTDGTIKDEFTIIKESITSVRENGNIFKDFKNLKVIPNPFGISTTISYELDKAKTVNIQIYSLDGKEIHTLFKGKQQTGIQNIEIDAAKLNLANGKYILKIEDEKNASYEHVLKVN